MHQPAVRPPAAATAAAGAAAGAAEGGGLRSLCPDALLPLVAAPTALQSPVP